ncbi:MAG: ferritin-like domain-containing protein [Polyangiaceae bacterium]
MRITPIGIRTQILALLASGTVAAGCGSVESDNTAAGGSSGAGASGGSAGAGATGGSAGSGATAGAGGAGGSGGVAGGGMGGIAGAGAGGAAGAGGVGGSGGTGGGLTTKGTVDCIGCGSWESCWPKDEVPLVPNAPPTVACPSAGYIDGSKYPYCTPGVPWFSGGTEDGNLCCYTTATCVVGRPLLVAGEVRAAPAVQRGDWARLLDALDAAELDDATRRELAAAWRHDAQMEHASVASFARLTLELMALGAPPDLLAESQVAATDEIEHARLCFGVAARLAGAEIGPGRLPIGDALLVEPTIVSLAVATFEEGCVGETVAAVIASAQANAAKHPACAAALEQIAEDESRHATFAWRVVRWALQVGGSPVREALQQAFARVRHARVSAPTPAGIDLETWHAFGRLTEAEIADIRAGVLREVVDPCLAALFGDSKPEVLAAGAA